MKRRFVVRHPDGHISETTTSDRVFTHAVVGTLDLEVVRKQIEVAASKSYGTWAHYNAILNAGFNGPHPLSTDTCPLIVGLGEHYAAKNFINRYPTPQDYAEYRFAELSAKVPKHEYETVLRWAGSMMAAKYSISQFRATHKDIRIADVEQVSIPRSKSPRV